MTSRGPSVTLIIAVLAASLHAPAWGMTIEEAYAAIPHQRPLFDRSIAQMAYEEADYLERLFEVIDLAVRERVETVAWLQSHGTSGENSDDYDVLLRRLHTLTVPERLKTIHRLVEEAVREHQDVLKEWRSTPERYGGELPMDHPLIRSSSQKLHEAYGEVLRLFPREDERNRQAFYDFFCSLDFL